MFDRRGLVNRNVLITGGSGFIGTNLVEHFHSRGYKVTNIDIVPPQNVDHSRFWMQVDVCNHRALRDAVELVSPSWVFHMAARTDLNGKSMDDYAANIEGVHNLINSVSNLAALQRIIFASSMLVCRLGYRPRHNADYNPTTFYGASKVEGERLVNALGSRLPWVIVRPTSLWGPWFNIPYRNFFDAVRNGWYVHPRGLAVRRSYGFVLNSVAQLERLAFADSLQVQGRTFYLADYQPVELRSWAELVRVAFAAPCVKEAPLSILRVVAKGGDMLRMMGVNNPPLTSFRLNNLMTEAVMDTTPLEMICGSVPYGLNQGVSITVDWIKEIGQCVRC